MPLTGSKAVWPVMCFAQVDGSIGEFGSFLPFTDKKLLCDIDCTSLLLPLLTAELMKGREALA